MPALPAAGPAARRQKRQSVVRWMLCAGAVEPQRPDGLPSRKGDSLGGCCGAVRRWCSAPRQEGCSVQVLRSLCGGRACSMVLGCSVRVLPACCGHAFRSCSCGQRRCAAAAIRQSWPGRCAVMTSLLLRLQGVCWLLCVQCALPEPGRAGVSGCGGCAILQRLTRAASGPAGRAARETVQKKHAGQGERGRCAAGLPRAGHTGTVGPLQRRFPKEKRWVWALRRRRKWALPR